MGRNLRIKIDNQDFETDSTHKNNIFAVNSRHKTEIIKNLQQYVYRECNKCWQMLPREVATLKRRYLKELCDALLK